jgi:phosphoserine aminotransferase
MSEVELRSTTINLNAGPSPLPLAALQEAASALLSFTESPGMGIAEISHRSPAFSKVIAAANEDIKLLLQIPDNYRVLWMQGGGLTQFSATVLNLLAWYRLKHQLDRNDEVVAEYAVTGSWSLKAAEEGQRMGAKAKMVIDARKEGNGKFTSIPKLSEWAMESQISNSTQRKPAFIYYCDNETVDGVEFPAVTKDDRQAFPIESIDPEVPIVCDMSSNFLSRPVDISKYGIIYAGAQKNLGPAGVSVIIIREDLLGESRSP